MGTLKGIGTMEKLLNTTKTLLRRTFMDLVDLWEGEVVAKAVYLVNSSDDQLKGVVRHQLDRAGHSCLSLIIPSLTGMN